MADKSTNPFAGTPFTDFDKLSGEMYRGWEKSMTQWWDQVLDDPNFLGAIGKKLETGARARGAYQKSVDETLERMHLPTRSDMTRLARIASLLEDRLLSMEDTLLEMNDKLESVEKESIKARIESTETRLELRERLAALEARLAAIESPKPASKPAPRKAAPRKAAARKPAANKPAVNKPAAKKGDT